MKYDKDAEKESPPSDETETPFERFSRLAGRIARVTKDKLRENHNQSL